uniref:Uncharacterized protein LOC111115834 isoform X2 n=1 Tax=Crassostrea virginica TaxID=6565 RepID=A0A8B8C3X4_CRAVI|nr:uncharacterized protein LOC111115834 isoform X2 [Crassostrea virginica]
MAMLRKSAVQILLCTIFKIVGALNQCSDTEYKELGDLAKRSPTYMYDAAPLCDRYLMQGWYRAGLHQIPTTDPWLATCGTLFPYWMDDTAPSNEGETKSVKVCQVGFSGPCERTHNIRMTNCGKYYVYELIPLDICNAAYCFEPDNTCVSDIPKNIEVKYHSVSWTTTQEGVTTHYDPDINLVCHFDRLPDDALFYDVTWYVDNTEVLTNQTVSSNSSDVALLSGSQMVAKGKKANSMIHCVVGAVFKAEDRPCNTNSSGLFFAGIKMITPKLRIPRGGSAEAQFQFTIPFISRHSIIKVGLPPPLQGVKILEHQMALFVSMYITGGPVDCNDLDRKACDVQVKAFKRTESEKYDTDDWRVIHTKKVYNRDDGDFDILDKQVTLRFATGVTNGVGSKFFDSITLQDIQVFIEETDSSWKGTYCESHTDPHMKTFDGKYYECQLDGTFVLYRNDPFEQEVQEKHHLCHPSYSYPRCSCAVAVRSGKDIFTVDICNSRTIINFPLCEDKTLNVIKKNDRYYKIIFPTGTMVEIKFISWPTQNDWQLNVDIFPSPSDVGNSSGLCGVLDGNYRNDFTRNDDAKTMDNPDHHNPPNAFSESWRVKNNELNLFDESTYGNLESISHVYERVCSCKKIADDKPADIECNYGTYKNCKFVVGKKFHCMLNPEGHLRRKRDLRHIESLLLNSYERNESKLEERRPKREAITILKTYEEAEDICLNAFQNSQSYQTCKEYISDLSNTSIVNCISDVMMTGDDNFTKIHIEAALEQCSVFVVLNTTFQQTEPEITSKIETLCQNNCSGHGICKDGNCTCEPEFAGSDCSFDLLGPPSITHISDFGLCDKSKENCEEITVYGKYFIENMNTNCYMTRKTYQTDGITVSMVDYEANLQERTLFEGFCPLEYTSDDHWVTAFTFNISNDGSRFTEIYFVYTYQSLCQEYQNNTGTVTFLFKDGFCYINNKCIPDGSTDEDNNCNICNANRMKYEWSFNPGHCFIDGICYKSGDINGTNPCSVCMPTTNTTTWSPDPHLCFINGICYLPDQTKLGSECYACESNASRDSWTFKDGYCLINNECFLDGEANGKYQCQICDVAQSYYSWILKIDHCFIDGSCYKSGDINGTNPCDICIPTVNTTTWSPTPDMCFIDEICYLPNQTKTGSECFACESNASRNSWTFKDDHCFIDGSCYKSGDINGTNPCDICIPTVNTTTWSPTPDMCFIDEICYLPNQTKTGSECFACKPNVSRNSWTFKDGYCLINKECFIEGELNEMYPCQICDIAQCNSSWTLKPDHCLIEGICYKSGDINKTNPCDICMPTVRKTTWSLAPDLCFIDEICYLPDQTKTGSECFACESNASRNSWTFKDDHCFIDGSCYKSGDINGTNPCDICIPTVNTTTWSPTPDMCFIDEICYLPNQTKTGSECFACKPNASRNSWTFKDGYCLINKECFIEGELNEMYPCQICDIAQCNSSWTLKPDHCFIDGSCYKSGDINGTNPCDICIPTVNTTTWSPTPDMCFIDEICYLPNQTKTGSECFACKPNASRNSWTFKDGYCLINKECFIEGELNEMYPCQICDIAQCNSSWTLKPDHCFIDGSCYKSGDINGTNPCDICIPTVNTTTWSPTPDMCLIDGVCYLPNQTKIESDCFACESDASRNSWTLKDDHCFIDGSCYKSGDINGTNPCDICIPTVNTTTWSPTPDMCFIDEICYLPNQTKTGSECFACESNASRNSWTFKDDHCFIDGSCYKSGDINGTNPCDICIPTVNTTTWSPTPDMCFIDEICYLPDQSKTGSECFACKPNASRNSWTFKDGYCLINKECFIEGESNEMLPCQICDVAQCNSSWTLKPGNCLINEVCYKSGDANGKNNCTVCIPEINSTTWSLAPDMCFIDNTCYPDSQQNPDAECSICKSELSRTAWTQHDGCFSTSLSTAANEQLTSTDMSLSSRLTSIDTATSAKSVVATDQITTHLQLTSQSIEELPTTNAVETLTKTESPTTVESTTKKPKLTTTITKAITAKITEQSKVSDTVSTEPITIQVKTTNIFTVGTEKPITPFTSESITEHTTSNTEPRTKSDKTTEISTEESSKNSRKPVTEQSSITTLITTEQRFPAKETTERYIESTTELITSTKAGPLTNNITAPMDGTLEPTTKNHQQTPIVDTTMSYTTLKSTQSLCWESPEDVTVVYHNVSWISITETANRTVHEPSINLRCNFSLLRDVSLHYSVEWYVDEDILVKESQVNPTNIERSILSMQDLFPWSMKAGAKIRCKVGVMVDANEKPCTFSTSPGFIAGIKILDTTQTILRKGKSKVAFHLTIPYISSIIETNGQIVHPNPLEVHSVLLPDSTGCEDSLGVDKCVIYISAFPYTDSHRFESDLWRKTHVITVYHMDTNNYKVDSTKTFGLKTITEGNSFWNDVFYHNVTIYIKDRNDIWKGKFCGSKTDPHFYTFDGVSYENHISGDFILYRNTLFNQEIQTTHRLCFPSYNFPYCTCAVSIQSGQDVFLIDVCDEKAFIDYLSCNDSVMQVDKLRDKLYKIVLPTGTLVLVTLVSWPIDDAWQLDIELFPSLSDVNNTYGLCGTLDGIKDNEFTRRDGYKDNVALLYPNEFSRSWNVQDGENLFMEPIINRQTISSTLDHICTCTPNGKTCLYKTFKSCLMEHEIQCTAQNRSQNRLLSIKVQKNSSENGESQLFRKKRQTFTYVKTHDEAQNICFAAFQVSETYRMCKEHVNDLSNSSYVNCIIDLTMTGDVNITTLHVESAIQQCATFIKLNDTLQSTNPDVTNKLKSFCPRNCSYQGYCIKGKCTCNQGYGGSDCSFDRFSAPEIWSTFPSNVCDKSTQSCSRMNFRGRYFIENIKKTCYIQRTLARHDGSAINMAYLEQPLTAHNLFRGSCLLPFVHDAAWVTQYTLNVSYDGKEFTESIKLYVYQSECQQHISDDGRDQFLLKEGFCYISNTCVTQGYSNSNDSCYMCDPTSDKYTWTQNTDCVISSSPTPEEFTISSMIYILIACIAVIIVVVPVAIWRYRKSHGYKQFYRIEDHRKEINEELTLKFTKNSKNPEDYVPMTQID